MKRAVISRCDLWITPTASRLYLPDTNVLLTRFFSPEGLAETLDFMPIVTRPGERHRLVRNVRVIRGRMDFRAECLPAFDYARRDHTVSVGKTGAVFASGDYCLGLATDVRLEKGAAGAAGAYFALGEGERATFVLAHLKEGEEPGEILSDVGFEELLHSTLRLLATLAFEQHLSGTVAGDSAPFRARPKAHGLRPDGSARRLPHDGSARADRGRAKLGLPLHLAQGRGADALRLDLRRLRGRGAGNFMGWLRDRCHEDEDGLLQPLYGIDGRKDITERSSRTSQGT